MHTPYETALLLAFALKESGQNRARISAKTLRFLGRRKNLRYAFAYAVAEQMAELGWTLIELPGVGFGAIQTESLAAAKAVTGAKWLSEELLKRVKAGKVNFSDLATELDIAPDYEEE